MKIDLIAIYKVLTLWATFGILVWLIVNAPILLMWLVIILGSLLASAILYFMFSDEEF